MLHTDHIILVLFSFCFCILKIPLFSTFVFFVQISQIVIIIVNYYFQSTDESVNVLYHPPDLEGPVLFSYREKVFFGKKRAAVRVENGEWSEKFALDAAGSTGLVECKADNVTYEVS